MSYEENHEEIAIERLYSALRFKGIRFIVLYPPKRSHDLPPLAGTVHIETISISRGYSRATDSI